MAAPSWISFIQGVTTLLTGNGQTTARRQVLKVSGIPVFDDGTQSVLGGIQVTTGSATWDGKSGTILVGGTGARAITLVEPDATLKHAGLQILIAETANQAGVVTITPSPAGAINVSANLALAAAGYTFARLVWLSNNQWMKVGTS